MIGTVVMMVIMVKMAVKMMMVMVGIAKEMMMVKMIFPGDR